MRKVFLISFLSAFIITISTTAFEDINNKKNIKLVYELKDRQFELQSTYCSSFDSYIINKLYS